MQSHADSIENRNLIDGILDLIHDCHFEIDEINFDPQSSILTIPFGGEVPEERTELAGFLGTKKVEIPLKRRYLRIFQVRNYFLNDTDGIGACTFSDLIYDADRKLAVPLQNLLVQDGRDDDQRRVM